MAIPDTTQVKEDATVSTRPPVVVVLGHVDHGKSSILDAIREDFHITSRETGGITQCIGAYVAEFQGKKITFIDTPGHEAFSAVRSRGAKVADIAVLVVAADEGVKPQTKEAIEQAKQAQLPLVVALNKTDRPEAQPQRVKEQLAKAGVLVESFGGKIPSIETSARERKGIKELLEMILLVAEMEDLKADPGKPAQGVVIESFMDPKRGPAATLLVQEGTLHLGDVVGTPCAFGKVLILEDFQGETLQKAFPATPCLVIGFQNLPATGEQFQLFDNEDAAKAHLGEKTEQPELPPIPPGLPTLDIILKVDVLGSLEVLQAALLAIPQDKVALRFVDTGVGEISENDVKTALGTNARIMGFRTKVNAEAGVLAQREQVPLKTFEVIYDLIEEVRKLMEKTIEPQTIKRELGSLKVQAIFLTEKNRQIIGGKIQSGELRKGAKVELFREEELVGQGKIINLQQNKKDVGSAKTGEECGILYEGPGRVQEGDIVRAFLMETKKASL